MAVSTFGDVVLTPADPDITSAAVPSAQLKRYGHAPRDMDGLHAHCDVYAPFETELDRSPPA